MFHGESKSTKIPKSHYSGRGLAAKFQSQLQSFKTCSNLNFQFPGGVEVGGGIGHQLPEPISNFQNLNPNLKFLFQVGWGGVWWGLGVGEHQLLVLTSCENLGWTKNFDKNFPHPVWVSASQIASLRKLKTVTIGDEGCAEKKAGIFLLCKSNIVHKEGQDSGWCPFITSTFCVKLVQMSPWLNLNYC